ncbi:MAG: hypothetical protein J7L22_01565 [Candidatus Marinimicrobia bacterium]|nr:hypothetical protein [Candidatus Neomarinimicrobiota bacterium]
MIPDKFFSLLSIICLFANLMSCSVYEETVPNTENINLLAWESFEEGDYQTAYSKFGEVLDIDPRDQEALHGRAWSALLLSDALDAIKDFKAAIYYGNSSLDPLAGLAFAYHANQEYSMCINKAKAVLASNTYYYFEHKPVINFRDLHLILASAYFQTGNLSRAYEHILILQPDISFAQPDSSHYEFNGQLYSGYSELILAIIDYLDVLYGM